MNILIIINVWTDLFEILVIHYIIFQYVVENLRITHTFQIKINEFVEAHMFIIDQEVQLFLKKPKPNEDELTVESIYSGMAGVALLYNFYANKTQNKNKTLEVCLVS